MSAKGRFLISVTRRFVCFEFCKGETFQDALLVFERCASDRRSIGILSIEPHAEIEVALGQQDRSAYVFRGGNLRHYIHGRVLQFHRGQQCPPSAFEEKDVSMIAACNVWLGSE